MNDRITIVSQQFATNTDYSKNLFDQTSLFFFFILISLDPSPFNLIPATFHLILSTSRYETLIPCAIYVRRLSSIFSAVRRI